MKNEPNATLEKLSQIDKFSINEIDQYKARFLELLTELNKDNKEVVFLCIGTDRCTGDALAPLLGMHLEKYNIKVVGNIFDTVNSKNLNEKIEELKNTYPDPFIIAVDASLGNINDVGKVTVRKGGLEPGIGVGKDLGIVGNIGITGVVNISGMSPYIVLQNTQLGVVYKMVNFLEDAIVDVMTKVHYVVDTEDTSNRLELVAVSNVTEP